MTHPDTPELDQPLQPGQTGTPLTRKESREIVTPYAFEVDQDLWGVPTASPFRRLVAMGIDSIIISALANASMLMIGIVMGYMIYCRALAKRVKHVVICVLVAIALLSIAYYSPDVIVETDPDQAAEQVDANSKINAGTAALVVKAGIKLRQKECEQSCMDAELEQLAQTFAKNGVDKVIAVSILNDLMDGTDYPAEAWEAKRSELVALLPDPAPVVEKPVKPVAKKAWYEPPEGVHSFLEWGKSLLLDIGFGVGWAVFYFTFTIYWCHGQTLGKKLLGIKVIQLDGKELNLFNSFSRQGGYGAGFATGLLGFLQVYWDPNRQAIQDKVVSTVVIRLGQAKRPLTH